MVKFQVIPIFVYIIGFGICFICCHFMVICIYNDCGLNISLQIIWMLGIWKLFIRDAMLWFGTENVLSVILPQLLMFPCAI